MNIVLTGANGQVGQAIQRYALENDITIIALPRQELDISDSEAVKRVFSKYQPDVVINAAAYTAVDLAEEQVAAAELINAQGPAILAKACQQHQSLLIHLSTDYVFDGTSQTAYIESDVPNPINVYGRTKLAGEKAIQELCSRYLILRVSWVFGLAGQNFVKTILKAAQYKEELQVVNDQYGCPTSAASIADVIFQVIDRYHDPLQSGIYHYCNYDATTWFGFTEAIIDSAKEYMDIATQRILPIATSQMPRPAKRPMNSRLNCNKIKQVFGIIPAAWREELQYLLQQIH